jgi:protein-disulfide isomerase
MRKLVGVCLLALLAACGSNSEDMKKLEDSQREILAKLSTLEKKIEENPGRRAVGQRSQIDPNKVYDIPVGDSPFKGPANAPVVLTEFADFQCPFCGQVPGLVDQVLKAYPKEVKFVYKQFPLTSIHRNALNAARAAVAAQKQGKFWQMYEKLFANQRALSPDDLKQYAQATGLNVAQFEKDMTSPDVQKEIDNDIKLGQEVQVRGTPTLFLNGKRVMNRGFEGIKEMIDLALRQKG